MPESLNKYNNITVSERLNQKAMICLSMCSILQTAIEKNELVLNNNNQFNYSFFCQVPPQVSIKDYLERIIKYSQLENSSLILAVIYLNKITTMSDIIICTNNVHK
jgi:hypothetical protein